MELSSINKVSLVRFLPVVTLDQYIRDNPYWASGESSLELIKLSSINKVS